MERHAQFLIEQKKEQEKEKEKQKKELELKKQITSRANRFQEKYNEKAKADIAEYHKKKEQERQEKERQEKEEKRASSKAAAKLLAENQIKIQEQIKERSEKAKKDAQLKALTLERQNTLPQVDKNYTFKGY